MTAYRTFFAFLPAAILLCSGCAVFRKDNSRYNQPTTVTNAIPAKGVLENGYALLFDLLGDEKDVSKLRFIKSERDDLKELLNDIARVSANAYLRMEEFGKADPTLNLKNEGLPLAELATRKLISKSKTHVMLHDKGSEFEVQMLMSQSEALVYGGNLARVLSSSELDVARSRFLSETANRLQKLNDRVVELLVANYNSGRFPGLKPSVPK
jgi:hypothetical protein